MYAKKMIFRMFFVLTAVLLISSTVSARPLADALGTSFTYQGRLTDGGAPANGIYDLEFKLYDALVDGSLWGSTNLLEDVPVSGGLFTVQLDFGGAFNGTALYLQIGVRPGTSTGAYTPLTPRQPLTPSPYALYALKSGNADTLDGLHSTAFLVVSDSYSDPSWLTSLAGSKITGSVASAASAASATNATNATFAGNADTLDGNHASAFALANHNHWGQTWGGSGTGLSLAGGTEGLHSTGTTYGVYGAGTGSISYGVYGVGSGSTSYGVYGSNSSGTGTYGISDSKYGVYGASNTGTGVNGIGVTGVQGNSNTSGGSAIYGHAYGGAGTNFAGWFDGNVQINGSLGLTSTALVGNFNADMLDGSHASDFALAAHNHWGQTWTGSGGTGLTLNGGTFGVYGSGTATGVLGTGNSIGVDGEGNNFGVYAQALSSSGKAIYGRANGGSGNYAGYFDGNVQINGNQTVTGTKSAVVDTKDYGTRTLYSVESPENWFEDFGTGQLVNGTALITIEPIFAQTVNLTGDYHVFLTPVCEMPVLTFVTQKTSIGFSVSGVTLDNQPSQCSFDYRIVARRLGYEDTRLLKSTVAPPTADPSGK